MDIAKGATVRHITHDQKLIVEDIDDKFARCKWFDGHEIRRDSFMLSELVLAPNKAPAATFGRHG